MLADCVRIVFVTASQYRACQASPKLALYGTPHDCLFTSSALFNSHLAPMEVWRFPIGPTSRWCLHVCQHGNDILLKTPQRPKLAEWKPINSVGYSRGFVNLQLRLPPSHDAIGSATVDVTLTSTKPSFGTCVVAIQVQVSRST